MRKLAEQSSNAAKDINSLIKEIQSYVGQSVVSMHEANNIVIEQELLGYNTTNALNQITDMFIEIEKQIHDVSISSQELGNDTGFISEAISNIVCISEENSAGTEELAASSEEQMSSIQQLEASMEFLAKSASVLGKSLEKFKI